MRTRLVLRPGQAGTKKAARKYGDRLLAVRYVYDDARRRRYKTVELIEEQLPWDPPPSHAVDKALPVRIPWNETELRNRARAAGGRWDPNKKVWLLSYESILDLGLESRVTETI